MEPNMTQMEFMDGMEWNGMELMEPIMDYFQ
jgi:hypothetical protein